MDSSNRSLEIIKDDSINPAVFKANRFIISQHKDELTKLPDEEKRKFISDQWKKIFHATVISDPNSNVWTHLEFFSEQDLMLFWMKWKT